MRRAPIAIVVAAAAVSLAVPALAGTKRTPARDSFSGGITSGTGGLSSARGQATIRMAVAQSSQAKRKMTLTVSGARCGSRARCLRLTGTLNGTIATSPSPTPADVGPTFTLRAAGRLKPLGHVSTNGTVHGTGFIAHGREQMVLTVRARRGTVTLRAQSGWVGGFTSP